jgi:transcriptional regulator
MYLRAVHAEFDIRALREFIKQNPFGIFITAIPSPNYHTIQCTHIPWVLDVNDEDSDSELGSLRGHLARQNPHTKALIEATQAAHETNGMLEQEISIIFNGPVQSYVTPKFYTETKPTTGRVVPTWNYSAVQVYGKATIYFDTKNSDTGLFLQSQVEDLTNVNESKIISQMSPAGETNVRWQVGDAPTSYVEILKKGIIGIKIDVERLEGKYKMTQEMEEGDRRGVIEGFRAMNTEAGLKMAETVEERGALKGSIKKS